MLVAGLSADSTTNWLSRATVAKTKTRGENSMPELGVTNLNDSNEQEFPKLGLLTAPASKTIFNEILN